MECFVTLRQKFRPLLKMYIIEWNVPFRSVPSVPFRQKFCPPLKMYIIEWNVPSTYKSIEWFVLVPCLCSVKLSSALRRFKMIEFRPAYVPFTSPRNAVYRNCYVGLSSFFRLFSVNIPSLFRLISICLFLWTATFPDKYPLWYQYKSIFI